jgi:hypothetical protein
MVADLLHPHQTGVKIRNTTEADISKIIDLQKESFPYLARYSNFWRPEELKSHLRIFPEGQFVAAEQDGTVVGSASTLMVSLDTEMQNIRGKELLLMVCSQIIILSRKTAFMVQIFLHIQNIDMKARKYALLYKKGIGHRILFLFFSR